MYTYLIIIFIFISCIFILNSFFLIPKIISLFGPKIDWNWLVFIFTSKVWRLHVPHNLRWCRQGGFWPGGLGGSGGSQEGHDQGVPPKGLQQDLEVGFRSLRNFGAQKDSSGNPKDWWFWGKNVPFSRGHFRSFILVFEGFFSFKVGFWLVSGSFRFTLSGGYRSDHWASIPSEMYMVFTISSYPLWSFGAHISHLLKVGWPSPKFLGADLAPSISLRHLGKMISMLTNLFFKWVETSTYEYLFEMASFFWRSGIVSFRECISVGEKRVLKLFFSFWFTDDHGKMVAILKFPGVHHPISSQIITTSVISSPLIRRAKSMGQRTAISGLQLGRSANNHGCLTNFQIFLSLKKHHPIFFPTKKDRHPQFAGGKVVTLKVMHHQCRRHHHHAKASPEVLAPDPHCLVVDQGRRQDRNCSQTGHHLAKTEP